MDELEEYHKLTLLAANFVAKGTARPMHIINNAKALLADLGALGKIFEPLDDDSVSLIPHARAVGAAQTRGSRDDSRERELPKVIVI